MSTRDDDYLWDPTARADPEIAKLERSLARYSARALKLASRHLPLSAALVASRPSTHWKAWHFAGVAAAVALSIATTLYFYRLSWPDSSPWPVTIASHAGAQRSAQLRVGERVTTSANQTATLSAARIGTVSIAENSSVALVQTRSGRHRLELNYGRLRAKVWAPPGYFGVANRDALALDLGCEFEMEKTALGAGSLAVISGWVIYNLHGAEVLVPAGHSIVFDNENVGTPVRSGSDPTFIESVVRFDAMLASGLTLDSAEVIALAEKLASLATDADYLTLLSLVTRHSELMDSPLSARLESVLGDPGEIDPLNAWWRRVPKPPKQWWWNWRDAF